MIVNSGLGEQVPIDDSDAQDRTVGSGETTESPATRDTVPVAGAVEKPVGLDGGASNGPRVRYPRPFSPNRFLVRAVVFELGLGAVAAAIGWIIGHNPFQSRPVGESLSLTHSIAWGIAATGPMIVALLVLDRYPVGPLRDLQRLARDLLVPLFAEQKVWQLLVLSAAAGMGEEALFRGLVQGGLADWLTIPHSEMVACLAAAVVFGLCHWLSATYAFLATCVGLYLGWLYLATGSLIPPIIVHALYDFVALVYLVKGNSRGGSSNG